MKQFEYNPKEWERDQSGNPVRIADYLHAEPDSHFWDRLAKLINWTKLTPDYGDGVYHKELTVGLENTKKQGYDLLKKDEFIKKDELKKYLEYTANVLNEKAKKTEDKEDAYMFMLRMHEIQRIAEYLDL